MIGFMYMIIFLPMAAAMVCGIAGWDKKHRDLFIQGTLGAESLLSLLFLYCYFSGVQLQGNISNVCGMGIHFTADGFRVIYVGLSSFLWLMAGLIGSEYFDQDRKEKRYQVVQLVTLGATQAIFLSADLYTMFIFFEVMSLSSCIWVAQEETTSALRAAQTYLAVSVAGGMVMLMGLFLLYGQTGTLVISQLPQACEDKNVYAAALCLFVGFGAKAGAFPLHFWMPKAYPAAPTPATALLSGILSKTGILGILIISVWMLCGDGQWGTFVLLVGVVTMVLGGVLALFSVDLKKTLAGSSASQIGFILVGVGMMGLLGEESLLAARGTFLHMVNHSLFKLLLFLIAAVIGMRVPSLDLNVIRGYGRKKPLLAGCFLMGALGIGGVPLGSGYISKTLLHESIVEYLAGLEQGHFQPLWLSAGEIKWMEWAFLFSGGLTVAYMCKLFVAIFVEENQDTQLQKNYLEENRYASPVSAGVLSVCAAVIPLLGVLPQVWMESMAKLAQSFFRMTGEGHWVSYFAFTNLKGSLVSLLIGMALYLLVVRGWMMTKQPDGSKIYVDRWPRWMDLEELVYRPVFLIILPGVFGRVCSILSQIPDLVVRTVLAVSSFCVGIMDIGVDGMVVLLRKTVYRDSPKERELEEGNALTHVIGVTLNALEQMLNRSIWKNHIHKQDLEHWFVLKYASFKENATVIGRSLSYGLVAFCIGLCATLLYLLVSAFL